MGFLPSILFPDPLFKISVRFLSNFIIIQWIIGHSAANLLKMGLSPFLNRDFPLRSYLFPFIIFVISRLSNLTGISAYVEFEVCCVPSLQRYDRYCSSRNYPAFIL